MTGLVISNLIIIVVILSSVEDSGFLKKPEKTLEVIGLKEERLTQTAEKLGNFAKIILRSTRRREKNGARNNFQIRQDSTQDSSQDSPNSRNALLVMGIQDSVQDSSNARNSQVVSGALNLGSRIDSIKKRIRTMIPSVISSVESDIAKSNEDNIILGLPNFFGMFFGCLTAIAFEVNRQNCLDDIDTENQQIHCPNENGNMGCRVYKGGTQN